MKIINTLLFCTLVAFVWHSASYAKEADIQAAEVSLTKTEREMLLWIDKRKDKMLAELKTHVEINTGTDNIEGLNQYRELLDQNLQELGFLTHTRASAPIEILTCAGAEMTFADHLVAERRPEPSSASGFPKRKILLNGHIDTVFSKSDDFQTLIIEKDGTLKGPGVGDMKGGIIVLLNALRALQQKGLLNDTHLTILFNTDEEVGSLGSRPIIEELAQQHDIGLIFEGSHANKVTRARKGLGQARLRVTGRESHAGAAHEEGVSANLELAHKVVEIEKLTDYAEQSTVNVGTMAGGEKRNTVPGCAEAYIDLRFSSEQKGQALKDEIVKLAATKSIQSSKYPEFPKVESWAVLHRPVKPVNSEVDELIAQAMGLSALIGEPILGTRYSGGGTDGSIAQGVGLPTFDSLGVDTVGAHSSREKSHIDSLMARTKLAAVLLARQIALEVQ